MRAEEKMVCALELSIGYVRLHHFDANYEKFQYLEERER
jgi:hypothetical protein